MSVRFYGYCTGSERQPCNISERAVRLSQVSVQSPYDFPPQFPAKILRIPARLARGLLLVPLRASCKQSTTRLRATGLRFFRICQTFHFDKIVEAAAPVNPYDVLQKSHGRLLPSHGGCTEMEIRAVYGLRKAIVSQM